MDNRVPTKVFLKLSPDTAMLFAPPPLSKPHPPINKLTIVTVLRLKPLIQTGETSLLECKALQHERTFLNPFVYTTMERNGLLSANQGVSKAEPRHNHAVCSLQVRLPTSSFPNPLMSLQ